jgi:hypothetical protein
MKIFENRVLRVTSGPETEEIIGGLRKPPNEDLHNLFSWPNVIRTISSRRIGWTR